MDNNDENMLVFDQEWKEKKLRFTCDGDVIRINMIDHGVSVMNKSYDGLFRLGDLVKIDDLFNKYLTITQCFREMKDIIINQMYDVVIKEGYGELCLSSGDINIKTITLRLPIIKADAQIIEELCSTITTMLKKQKELEDENNDYSNRLKRLEKIYASTLRYPISNGLFTSLLSNENDYNRIRKWIKGSEYNTIGFRMIHKGSINSFNSRSFNRTFQNETDLLYIILLEGNILVGGYTSHAIMSIDKFKQDKEAFIFSLTDIAKYIPREYDKAIYLHENYFCHFGEDLVICNDCDKTTGNYSYFPKYYGMDCNKKYKLTNGKENFRVLEIEVYKTYYVFPLCNN